MNESWNERYRQKEYAYGREANIFFARQLNALKPGKLLLPAEGEGRNAVFAARHGWNVTAFDFSDEGRKKALALADKQGVQIDYRVCDAATFVANQHYDALALIYTHFASSERSILFPRFLQWLRPGGALIMEVFSKSQLGRSSGGPKDLDLLYSLDEVRALFPEIKFTYLSEDTVVLDEGPYHQGEAKVIRMAGIKV